MIRQITLCIAVLVAVTSAGQCVNTALARCPGTNYACSCNTCYGCDPNGVACNCFNCGCFSKCPNCDVQVVSTSMGHYRQCEGTTKTYACQYGRVLHLGGCWYGSPANDPGYNMCPHSAKGHCNPVTGNCVGYIWAQCQGKTACTVTINNANMGGDPCPNIYKFGAIAMKCVAASSAQAEPLGLIDDGTDDINGDTGDNGVEYNGDYPDDFLGDYGHEYEPFEKPGDDYHGENYFSFQLPSQSIVYGIAGIVCLLLVVNMVCLAYNNCRGRKAPKYQKVVQYASSDDDKQNLKNNI